MIRRYILTTLAIALILFLSDSSLLGQPRGARGKNQAPKASNPSPGEAHRKTACTRRIRITWDPKRMTLDRNTLVRLLGYQLPPHFREKTGPAQTSFLMRELPRQIRQKIGRAETSFLPILGSPDRTSDLGFILADYTVALPSPKGDITAEKVLEHVIQGLRDLLNQEFSAYADPRDSRLHSAQDQKGRTRRELDTLARTLAGLTEEARKRDVRKNVEKNEALIAALEQQSLQTEISLAGKEARMVALRREMADNMRGRKVTGLQFRVFRHKNTLAELQKKFKAHHPRVKAEQAAVAQLEAQLAEAKAPAKKDPIIAELARILAIRERQYVQTKKMVSQGHASEGDLHAASAAMAECRIRLARRREHLIPASTGDPALLAKLRGEHTSLMIDVRELKARRGVLAKHVNVARKETRDLQARLRQLTGFRIQIDRIKRTQIPLLVKKHEKAGLLVQERIREIQGLTPPKVVILAPKKK